MSDAFDFKQHFDRLVQDAVKSKVGCNYECDTPAKYFTELIAHKQAKEIEKKAEAKYKAKYKKICDDKLKEQVDTPCNAWYVNVEQLKYDFIVFPIAESKVCSGYAGKFICYEEF